MDEEKRAQEWRIKKNKNQIFQQMAEKLTRSRKVDYILAGSKGNMKYVVEECETGFIVALKSNRLVARSEKEAGKGNFRPLEELKLGKRAVKLYLKGLEFPVLVVKKVFKTEKKVTVRCT
jgi:hypothetical protein